MAHPPFAGMTTSAGTSEYTPRRSSMPATSGVSDTRLWQRRMDRAREMPVAPLACRVSTPSNWLPSRSESAAVVPRQRPSDAALRPVSELPAQEVSRRERIDARRESAPVPAPPPRSVAAALAWRATVGLEVDSSCGWERQA
eukprot:350772-Chlamydomonas_euryale.AAC.1